MRKDERKKVEKGVKLPEVEDFFQRPAGQFIQNTGAGLPVKCKIAFRDNRGLLSSVDYL